MISGAGSWDSPTSTSARLLPFFTAATLRRRSLAGLCSGRLSLLRLSRRFVDHQLRELGRVAGRRGGLFTKSPVSEIDDIPLMAQGEKDRRAPFRRRIEHFAVAGVEGLHHAPERVGGMPSGQTGKRPLPSGIEPMRRTVYVMGRTMDRLSATSTGANFRRTHHHMRHIFRHR